MSNRAVPFHCPYCGDTNLWPREGGWECRSCLRAFSVTMLGQLDRQSEETTAAPDAEDGR